jgi:tetratricopeptide (TPR) repeat protein
MSALRLGFGIRARSYLDRFAAERPSSAWGAVAASESVRARAGRFDASEVLREARRLLEYATSGEQFEIVQTTLDLEVVASRDRGEYERALGLARAVYDASPRDLPLAGGLAREVTSCLAWLGRHEEAAAFAEEARASGKVDPTRETDMGATVALSLAAAGRHADALRLLERLSASPLPGELDARRMISVAIVRQSAGELDRAVAAWLDVPRLHPDIARVAESARLGAAELLAFAGRHDAARHLARRSERRPRRAAGEGHRLPPSLFAIAGDFAALLLILEDRTWGRREPGKDTFRDQVLHGILEEIVGDPERSRRNLEALVRSHGEGPFWRFVRPASYLLGKVSADDLRGNTAGFCLFAPELGSSSLFYMLSLVMRKRGDRREERLLLRLAIETDPWNYWPALLARRELGKLGPGMKRFLGKR